MNLTSSMHKWVLLLLMVAGCAGASATQQQVQSAPLDTSRPAQLVVYPFAVNPEEVTLNQSILQRAYRSYSGTDQSAAQIQLAHQTAETLCQQIASSLAQKGYNAVCQQRGVPVVGDNVLLIDGEFTDISEGNRLRRLVIGFGAGASTLDTSVHVVQKTAAGSNQLSDFTTHADSGKMPGAAVMGPAGAAAGGSAAVVVGANAAMGGTKSYTSSTGYLADKTASTIVDSITALYAQHGWTS